MKKVLTIAGTDPTGGAGAQADLKTFAAHKMYGMSVITALVAQNTQGVYATVESTPEFVAQQMDAVFTDIVPDAVKIGMVSNKEIIKIIAQKLKEYQVKKLVVDPVMVATSGGKLLEDDAIETLKKEFFPIATVITPNIPETEILCGHTITAAKDMETAAEKLSQEFHCAVMCKGGHLVETANDYLYEEGIGGQWLKGTRIDNPNTHGTGCTLSSAIACELAEGHPLPEAVALAKEYLTGALAAQLNLGKGSGPLDHMYWLERK